jgi:hypothetical protein
MKKKFLTVVTALFVAASMFLTACSDDGGSDPIAIDDFYGEFRGEHLILGLLPVGDTITITAAPLGADSITFYSLSLDASFNGKVTGADVAFADFEADSLMFSVDDNIYAKDILASGSAKLQSNKTTLKTSLKVDADVYNLDAVIPGQPSPKVFNNTSLPGTFNKVP